MSSMLKSKLGTQNITRCWRRCCMTWKSNWSLTPNSNWNTHTQQPSPPPSSPQTESPSTFTRCGLTFLKKSWVDTASASKPRTAFLSSPCTRPSCRACCSYRSFSRCTSCRSASRACGSGLGEAPLRGAVGLCLGYPRKKNSHLWENIQPECDNRSLWPKDSIK